MRKINNKLFISNNSDNKKKEAHRIIEILNRQFGEDLVYKSFFSIIPKLYKHILIQDGVMDQDNQQGEEKLKIYIFQKTDKVYKQEIFEMLIDYLNFHTTIAKLYYIMGYLFINFS